MHVDSACCGVECALFRKHYMRQRWFSFTFESVNGGHHVYKFVWTPFIEEILSLSAVD